MQNYLDNLNEAQRKAVINTDGPSLVIAGAGSGKTRVLTYRIARLIEKGVPPSSILALTFTNKAAREMKERIASVVGDMARYLWAGTFHSISSRILRAESDIIKYPSSFTIYDTQDSKSLIKTIINNMNLDIKLYEPNKVYNRISSAKNDLLTPETYSEYSSIMDRDKASRMPHINRIYKAYSAQCKNSGAMDFDDLLLIINILFRDHPNILKKYSERFKYILVDEYQDTNIAQCLLVKKLASQNKNICVVGDDAQSIYSFRGAKIENILSFSRDYPELQTYKLEQNYRSTQTIVNAANSLIVRNKNQIFKTVFSKNDKGNKIKVLGALTDNEEGYLVVNELISKRAQYNYMFSDFAILYRTNAQSRVFEEVLRKQNIPYKLYGGLSFYQRKEVKDVLAYYRLLFNPSDDEALKRVINYPTRGIGATSLGKLVASAIKGGCSIWDIASGEESRHMAGLNNSSSLKVQGFCDMMSELSSFAQTADAYDAAMKAVSETGIISALTKDVSSEGVARYENVQELLNAIREFSVSAKEEGSPRLLSNFIEDVALLTDQDSDKEENTDKVTLMTVHSSKGLEFKNIFVVGLEENLFPSSYRENTITINELEEERRLFYVAITRAAENACISFAKQRYRWGKLAFCNPSRFIGEIDPQFLDIKGLDVSNTPDIGQRFNTSTATTSRPKYFSKKTALISSSSRLSQNQLHSAGVKKHTSDPDFKGDDIELIQPGVFVEHQRFGKGKVISTEGKMPNKKTKVLFTNVGEKQLLLKFAKLKVIEAP